MKCSSKVANEERKRARNRRFYRQPGRSELVPLCGSAKSSRMLISEECNPVDRGRLDYCKVEGRGASAFDSRPSRSSQSDVPLYADHHRLVKSETGPELLRTGRVCKLLLHPLADSSMRARIARRARVQPYQDRRKSRERLMMALADLLRCA